MSLIPTTAPITRQARTGSRSGRVVAIGRCILGEFGSREAPKSNPSHAIALRELETLLRDRRRRRPISGEELATFVRIAVPRLLARAGAAEHDKAIAWARALAPELGEDWARRIVDRYSRNAPYKPRTIGDLLAVTREERDRLRLTKIRYAGQTDRRVAADRREKDREYQKRKRAAAGATPRENSLAALRPWEAEGISESTWRRRRKAADGTSSAPKKASPSYENEALDEIRSLNASRSEDGRASGSILLASRAVIAIPSNLGPIRRRALEGLARRSAALTLETAA
ncbi:hypothetical protein [Aureimonas ureilytica]|uniref:hypothetical protein n=1 Tax=Aureimonas ureilytica TaxID=401562 RepID=UPI000734516E|nr:hypothetical protein [Aureimonas ureilytica]